MNFQEIRNVLLNPTNLLLMQLFEPPILGLETMEKTKKIGIHDFIMLHARCFDESKMRVPVRDETPDGDTWVEFHAATGMPKPSSARGNDFSPLVRSERSPDPSYQCGLRLHTAEPTGATTTPFLRVSLLRNVDAGHVSVSHSHAEDMRVTPKYTKIRHRKPRG